MNTKLAEMTMHMKELTTSHETKLAEMQGQIYQLTAQLTLLTTYPEPVSGRAGKK